MKDFSIELNKSVSIGYEYFDVSKNSWGNSLGFTYYTARKGNEFSLENSARVDNEFEVSMITLFGNVVYRFDKLYIPFGLNFSSVIVKAPSAEIDSSSSGGLGYNINIGWMFTESIALEFGMISSPWELELFINEDDFTYSEKGKLEISNLKIKFAF